MINTTSKAKAIKDMCKECSYDPTDKGTWREQVQGCKVRSCPLYNFRPLVTGSKREDYIYLGDAK